MAGHQVVREQGNPQDVLLKERGLMSNRTMHFFIILFLIEFYQILIGNGFYWFL